MSSLYAYSQLYIESVSVYGLQAPTSLRETAKHSYDVVEEG